LLCIHRLYQSLIAVAQIDGTPLRRGLNDVVRPATVWLGDRLKRAVLSVIKSAVIKSAMIKSGVFHGTFPDAY
jgi:hypothetical protein